MLAAVIPIVWGRPGGFESFTSDDRGEERCGVRKAISIIEGWEKFCTRIVGIDGVLCFLQYNGLLAIISPARTVSGLDL